MAKKSISRKKLSVKNVFLLTIALGLLVALSFWVGRLSNSNAQYYYLSWNQQVSAIDNRTPYNRESAGTSSIRFDCVAPKYSGSRAFVYSTARYLVYNVQRIDPQGRILESSTKSGINAAGDAVTWYCSINRDKYGY